MKAQDIELLAGISLSDGGISLPLHTVLRKRPFRITMKTPTTRSLIRISKRYLRIGVTPEEYDAYDRYAEYLAVFHNGKIVGTYRIIDRNAAEKMGGFYTENEFNISKI